MNFKLFTNISKNTAYLPIIVHLKKDMSYSRELYICQEVFDYFLETPLNVMFAVCYSGSNIIRYYMLDIEVFIFLDGTKPRTFSWLVLHRENIIFRDEICALLSERHLCFEIYCFKF